MREPTRSTSTRAVRYDGRRRRNADEEHSGCARCGGRHGDVRRPPDGFSTNDLYVSGANRNEDGRIQIFHVEDDLRTWNPIPSTAVAFRSLGFVPVGGNLFGLGCEGTDPAKPASPRCLRMIRLVGTSVETVPPLDSGVDSPLDLIGDDAHRDLHILTFVSDAGPGQAVQHHRAHCE
jgi:hypothetical protein